MEDKISKLCFDKYSELGKNGKPREGEWTLLSGFVVERPNQDLLLVSLATGTKCIGKSKMSATGSVLNDSHSEVLSRRGLLRYIYENIKATQKGESSSIFDLGENGKFTLKPDIQFHFFCSHVPCGDASIIPMLKRKADRSSDSDETVKRLRTLENGSCDQGTSKDLSEDNLLYEDIHRTGGKCINVEDPHGPGPLYHTIGAIRTKPGRGEPTLSLSCSDKIAKWIYCGLQGALLSLLLNNSIHLKSITIGGGGQFCIKAMERALFERCNSIYRPIIKQSSLIFQHSRYLVGKDSNPCATSIIWSNVKIKPLEVSVEGKRLGITKKCKESASRLKISKMELFISFSKLTTDRFRNKTYGNVKSEAKSYYNKVQEFKRNMGYCWSTKPDLLNFIPDI